MHRDATFDKHEEITMLVLSAGLVPGRGLEASTMCDFSQTSREPAMTPHIDVHMQTRLNMTHAHTHADTHTHRGPGIESVHLPVMTRTPAGQEV